MPVLPADDFANLLAPYSCYNKKLIVLCNASGRRLIDNKNGCALFRGLVARAGPDDSMEEVVGLIISTFSVQEEVHTYVPRAF